MTNDILKITGENFKKVNAREKERRMLLEQAEKFAQKFAEKLDKAHEEVWAEIERAYPETKEGSWRVNFALAHMGIISVCKRPDPQEEVANVVADALNINRSSVHAVRITEEKFDELTNELEVPNKPPKNRIH